MRTAVDAGFARAFWTVFDAHVTNFVAGVVLYSYGSGPIRGFAVTLLVGIITNLFTSYWLSHWMFDAVVGRRGAARDTLVDLEAAMAVQNHRPQVLRDHQAGLELRVHRPDEVLDRAVDRADR